MKADLEKILLAAFFLLMLWISIGTFFSHELKHDFPYGYSAADAYQHQVRAEWIKEQGSYAREAPEIVAGYDDVIGYYMPGSSQAAAVFSYMSGMESYDALYFMVYFAAILAALVMYYGLRSYSVEVAMLSLPLMALVFAKNFYMGILLGQWPFTFGTLFLVGSFWALTKLELKRSALLVSLFVSAVALTHTSELVFVAGLVGVALLLALLKKDTAGVKKLVAAGAITAAASAYYTIIFVYTWGKQFGYRFDVEHVNQGFPNVRVFQDFQLWIIIIMLAGMIGIYYRNTLIAFASAIIFAVAVELLNLQAKVTSDFLAVALYALFVLAFLYALLKRKPEFAKALGPYMLIIGYASFVGFGARAFQTRFMWPVTLAPLFGFGAYRLLSMLKGAVKIKWHIAYTMAIAAILTTAVLAMNYEPVRTQGTMYNERWQMFNWLRENTEKNATVIFMYGDGYEQTSMLYNSGRTNFIVQTQDYIAALNNRTIKREYLNSINMDYGPGLPYRKGLFGFGYHLYDADFPKPDYDICRFDYYVFDKSTYSQQLAPLIQYNNAVKQEFINHGMEEAYTNPATSVVRNNNQGGKCVG